MSFTPIPKPNTNYSKTGKPETDFNGIGKPSDYFLLTDGEKFSLTDNFLFKLTGIYDMFSQTEKPTTEYSTTDIITGNFELTNGGLLLLTNGGRFKLTNGKGSDIYTKIPKPN